MATLALSVAGQFVGGALGGPIGATIGRALGALAGSAVDQALFAEPDAPRQLSDLRLQGSSEGGAIPRVYGWNRLAGNIIWATQLELADEANSGGKGFGGDASGDDAPVYLANFAVGLCEGPVHHIGRIWADGRLLEPSRYTIRKYLGNESQSADALIQAKQGVDKVPAYRGLCYLVFEALPLGEFGNRIPNISVEVCRVVGELENQIRAVTIIPGATEFGYDPEPRVRLVSPGVTALENNHLFGQTSDWTYSLDELQALCPNLTNVALVVAWFGNDLRCGQCLVQPRVENATRNIIDAEWKVSGKSRSEVPVMSEHEGGPAYGGTPSDATVLAAIADLKARGLQVTLYPLVLMDLPASNGLTDPYSGASDQPAYPWRGRITCDPAPGELGSPDMTGAVTTGIEEFLGDAVPGDFSTGSQTINFSGGTDWGFRRMILHYAHLCEMAGGVDAFLIGSEMRGLSFLRSTVSSFPFVDGLVDMAADVRSIVGLGTAITYAADWSEFSGLQPPEAPGDKLFHLDPLWASDDIDAVGIDNYMPITDWRGPGIGPDAEVTQSIYQLEYLAGNIAGGEGFDWYYASTADRNAGSRTPIVDGTYGEPWVWRFKDLVGWWQNEHHNRISGVRQETPTDWVPETKPLWLTELGCGAVDKGPNQPNIFGDAKSSEDERPYFSDGSPDALVQRQFLRAHHRHWQPGEPGFDDASNPVSTVYEAPMLDPDRIYCWTWDARPFPAFPQQVDVWSDGRNYLIGHWLTGRLGSAASDELIAALASDYDVPIFAASSTGALIAGLQIGTVASMRAAASPLWEATGISIIDTADGLVFLADSEGEKLSLGRDQLAIFDGPALKRTKPNADEVPGQLSLAYFDRDHDYQSASVVAIADSNPQKLAEASNLVFNGETARIAAETQLRRKVSAEAIELSLPPSLQGVEPGDRISLAEVNDGPFAIETVRTGAALDISGRVQRDPLMASFEGVGRSAPPHIPQATTAPIIIAAHVPGFAGDVTPTRLLFGAYAQPWPGPIRIVRNGLGEEIARLNATATIGELTDDLHPASAFLWDSTNQVQVQMYGSHLSSATEIEALAGVNRLVVRHDDGGWEVLGFVSAELTGPSTYVLRQLLRGRDGTDPTLQTVASAGSPIMLLNNAIASAVIAVGDLSSNLPATRFAGSRDLIGQSIAPELDLSPGIPLAPAALSALRPYGTVDIDISWARRTRVGGDSWAPTTVPLDYTPEAYRLRIYNGEMLVREEALSGPNFIYSEAMQISDFGAAATDIMFTVEQLSAVLGPGHAITGAFSG